jgi:hypothetical protein
MSGWGRKSRFLALLGMTRQKRDDKTKRNDEKKGMTRQKRDDKAKGMTRKKGRQDKRVQRLAAGSVESLLRG